MNKKTNLLKEGIPQLNHLILKLNILAKLAGQQLHEHFSLESAVPGLPDIIIPLLANPSDLKEFRCCQIRKDMVYEGFLRDFTDFGVKV